MSFHAGLHVCNYSIDRCSYVLFVLHPFLFNLPFNRSSVHHCYISHTPLLPIAQSTCQGPPSLPLFVRFTSRDQQMTSPQTITSFSIGSSIAHHQSTSACPPSPPTINLPSPSTGSSIRLFIIRTCTAFFSSSIKHFHGSQF
uniref:Uncharacterized protein n=1 Tax=Kalanchoe fedtschenkoi TaxID=63787 RepID=A0A7N0ULE4_KALFE